jgi:hypothetical protein
VESRTVVMRAASIEPRLAGADQNCYGVTAAGRDFSNGTVARGRASAREAGKGDVTDLGAVDAGDAHHLYVERAAAVVVEGSESGGRRECGFHPSAVAAPA